MRRIHNSHRPIDKLFDSAWLPPARKPNGFWWADGNGWNAYVDRFAPDKRTQGPYNYQVELAHDARIVTLRSWEDIAVFTMGYAVPVNPTRGFFWLMGDKFTYDPARDPDVTSQRFCKVSLIDWKAVSEDFDGIEIPDYRPGRMTFENRPEERPRVDWLDIDWCVSSGAVWNASAIKSISLIEPTPDNDDAPVPGM